MRAGSHSFVIFFFLAVWHHLYFVTDPLQFCLNLSPTQNYPYNFWNKYELGDDFTLIDLLKIWNWSNRLTLFSTLVLKGRAFNHQMGEWGQGSLKGLKLFHRVTFRHKDLALYIYIYVEREREDFPVGSQWTRIHVPMQETQVWSLVQEDSTCCGATNLVHPNHWVCEPHYRSLPTLEPHATATEACVPRACALQQGTLPQCKGHAPQLEKALHSDAAKN